VVGSVLLTFLGVQTIVSLHCLSCPVLSIVMFMTLLYCGQMVGRIKMKLGVRVGLGAGHTVLDGDPAAPPPKGHIPQFLAHICCGQMVGWIKMSRGVEVGLSPSHIVLDGHEAPPTKKWAQPPPNFRPMSVVAKRLYGSKCFLVRRLALTWAALC